MAQKPLKTLTEKINEKYRLLKLARETVDDEWINKAARELDEQLDKWPRQAGTWQ